MKRYFILFLFICLFIGCSRRPPENVVIELVKEYIKSERYINKCPLSWNTENINYDYIKIIEWGNFNRDSKYYPVKIHVIGSTDIYYWSNKNTKRRINWDQEIKLKIKLYKDDYGNKKWKRL